MKEYTSEDLIALGLPDPADVENLVNRLKEVLHGEEPFVQGGALADIVAMWFAGHHPDLRGKSIEVWVETMQRLIKINEKSILEQHGLTESWQKKPRQ